MEVSQNLGYTERILAQCPISLRSTADAEGAFICQCSLKKNEVNTFVP